MKVAFTRSQMTQVGGDMIADCRGDAGPPIINNNQVGGAAGAPVACALMGMLDDGSTLTRWRYDARSAVAHDAQNLDRGPVVVLVAFGAAGDALNLNRGDGGGVEGAGAEEVDGLGILVDVDLIGLARLQGEALVALECGVGVVLRGGVLE